MPISNIRGIQAQDKSIFLPVLLVGF